MTTPLLRLDSVSRAYERGTSITPVLRNVSLEVHRGQMVGIYGTRGSGKTTLLRIAAGFERPSGGSVSFDGIDLGDLDDDQLADLHRRQIAYAECEPPHLDDLPAIDYVAIPLYGRLPPTTARDRAAATLAQLGVGDARHKMWSDISNAGRVLVSLAHALVRQPRLLVIDDLTAYLGAHDRDYVLNLLRAAAENDGMGVLMTTPDTPEILQVEAHLLARGQLVTPGQSNVVDLSAHLA